MATKWNVPLLRQCFVTSGVALNLAAGGMVNGYMAGLLAQLQRPDSDINIDDYTGSWLASVPLLLLMAAMFIVPSLISRFGRRTTNFISIIPLFFGWISVYFAKNVYVLMAARAIQGIGMGIFISIGSLLVGEYTSPKKRGVFLMSMPVVLSAGVMAVHTMGSYMTWRNAALVSSAVNVLNIIIVCLSPESPSWLLDKGKYEECREAFRWLRGDGEELELKAMIDAKKVLEKSQKTDDKTRNLKEKLIYFKSIIAKKEFYMPTLLMMHIYTVSNWCGINILTPYADEILSRIISNKADVPVHMVALNVHRIIANIIAMFLVKQIKRRKLFFATVTLNILALSLLAGYTYIKENIFTINYDLIGVTFIHIMLFAFSTGSSSLSYIIAGEIIPLEYKTVAGIIAVTAIACNMFISVKSFSYLVNRCGIYGVCLINALIMSYCLIVVMIYLPETKDRTLQDIEDEIRGIKETHDEASVEPLKSENYTETEQ